MSLGASKSKNGPVIYGQTWTLGEAKDLVHAGYPVEYAVRRTGFSEGQITGKVTKVTAVETTNVVEIKPAAAKRAAKKAAAKKKEAPKVSFTAIREWARETGRNDVPMKGRISQAIIDEYNAAREVLAANAK